MVIAPTRSNYGRKINVKNRNKSTILIFLPAIIELVQELLISNMHNKLEEDTCENVEVIAPTRSNYWRKMRKIAINRPFWIFFQPLLNWSKNYLLVTCITNLKRICEKLFKLSRPQGQIIDVKWEKSQLIGHFFFFPAIIELVQELLISNIHNKFEENMWKTFQVIAPTRSNYWRKMRKIAINRPFFFFRPLVNLSKNYLLVTCITNLKRICEKLFNLSRPQGQIIDVKCEKSQ